MKERGKMTMNSDNRRCSIVSCIMIKDQNVIGILSSRMVDFFDFTTLNYLSSINIMNDLSLYKDI